MINVLIKKMSVRVQKTEKCSAGDPQDITGLLPIQYRLLAEVKVVKFLLYH